MTSEDEEFLMSTQDIVAEWEREKEAKGRELGVVETLVECLLSDYEARFGEVPVTLERLVQATHSPEVLRRWRTLLRTATVESFAQAVRDAQH